MKIRLRSRWSSPTEQHKTGDIIEVDDIIGKHLIQSRQAELISMPECEMIYPPENAMMPKAKPRKAR